MDAIDYAIYRYLARDGLVRFWACRRLVDPRVSVREIADRIGLSEAGVRSRLLALKKRGLLRGTEVHLNPTLFGASVVYSEVPVGGTGEADRLLRDLSVVDGVLFARDVLDEADRAVNVYYVADTPGATARRTALIRRLAPSETLRGPTPFWVPVCTRAPTPLDWKLLDAFRREPDATVKRFAARAKVSLRTATRRFGALIDSYSCWWSHSSDSEEWPLALLTISLKPGVDPPGIEHRIAQQLDSWMPVAPDGLGVDPGVPRSGVVGLIPAERPVALERAIRDTLALEGVVAIRRTFGLGSATYHGWADERIESRLANKS